ncbi:thiamine pyrophosphate-dependent enzyme, partial [Streptomyces sp. NPDC003691]
VEVPMRIPPHPSPGGHAMPSTAPTASAAPGAGLEALIARIGARTPRDGTPHDGTPHDGAPRDGTPRDSASRDDGPRDGGPRRTAPAERTTAALRRRFETGRRRTSKVPTWQLRPLLPSTAALSMADVLASGRGGPAPLVTVDVGLVTLWVYRYMAERQEFVWSSSFATMGSALPAAVALSRLEPDRPVVAAVGDGGIAVTFSELLSLARLDHPVTVVVFNNGKLGAIKFEQEIMGWPEYAAALDNGDLAGLARALGVPARTVATPEEFRAALVEARTGRGPFLVDALVDPHEIPAPAQSLPTATQVFGYAYALAREGARRLRGRGPEDGPYRTGPQG